ncbi:unnamed protein product [Larinioides sclopetarius]|uniref:Uncharacterized protein n=1 Tax=Larinioides sclopetarius TaxID=280406 RepID=A0AAV2BT38_9ARAC
MAFLGRSKKVDLQCLAEELGETVTKDMKVVDLKKKILGSTEYEEEFVKELLERIVNEREEEIKRQNELETERNDEALERVNGEYLTEIQQKQLKDLLYRYKTLFSGRIKRAKVGEHVIRYISSDFFIQMLNVHILRNQVPVVDSIQSQNGLSELYHLINQ